MQVLCRSKNFVFCFDLLLFCTTFVAASCLSKMTPYIVAPLVGSVIGYITNALAIRMLFRPHQAKFLFGHRIPFTPGIIPKEKGRIAASVGGSISENLMNEEVMEKSLLSEELLRKLSNGIDHFIDAQRQNPETLRSFLSHYLSEKEIDDAAEKGSNDLTQLIYKKLAESDVGDKIAHASVAHVMAKMQHFGSGLAGGERREGIGDLIGKGIRKIFGQTGADATSQLISSLAEPVEHALANNINEILHSNSREIVGDLINTESKSLLSRQMRELLAGKEQELTQARDSLVQLYVKIIRERLPRMLAAVDISKIIEDRINEMDMAEAERLILEVMDKELRAIVWLGAGLGFLMGFINCLL